MRSQLHGVHGHAYQVLIDHNNLSGFENIAEAREHLLRMGRREVEDPEAASWPIRGSHVVAPVRLFPTVITVAGFNDYLFSVHTTEPAPYTILGQSDLCAAFRNAFNALRLSAKRSTLGSATRM